MGNTCTKEYCIHSQISQFVDEPNFLCILVLYILGLSVSMYNIKISLIRLFNHICFNCCHFAFPSHTYNLISNFWWVILAWKLCLILDVWDCIKLTVKNGVITDFASSQNSIRVESVYLNVVSPPGSDKNAHFGLNVLFTPIIGYCFMSSTIHFLHYSVCSKKQGTYIQIVLWRKRRMIYHWNDWMNNT